MKFIILFVSLAFASINASAEQGVLFEANLQKANTKLSTVKHNEDYYLVFEGTVPASIINGTEQSYEFFAGFNKALSMIPNGQDFTVVLDSPGGYVFNVYQISLTLEAKCPTSSMTEKLTGNKPCTINTMVPKNASCSSACIALFMIGENRYADKEAVFGFHSAYVVNPKTKKPELLSGEVQKLYAYYGVDKTWLAITTLFGVFDTVKITPLKPYQMMGSKIVTVIMQDSEDPSQDYLVKM